MGPLTGKVALALGAEGATVATVYVSGRTVDPGRQSLPGTVGETAGEVCRRGGKGVAVVVDHRDDDQVAALFDQIHREQGMLDILVNNAFAMQELTVTKPAFGCSPEFPGRVIAALAGDPDVMTRSGGTFITAEVAQDYGITDIDGRVIPSLRAERGSPIWGPIAEAAHGR